MRFFQMAAQPLAGQMPIIILGGKPYMLQACDGRDVYCNALENWEPLSEGANGPHQWPEPYMVDPNTTEPWLDAIGGGIY